ncbi:MAG: alkaline phosphatase family protein [Acidobacteriota bacterium]
MTLRIIHVGVGVRGRHWLDVVASHPDFVSAACVDRDQKALDEVRALPGQDHGRFYTEYETALAETEADAVLIATPSFLHGQHSKAALEAGLAVLVEKPLASRLEEAAASVALARKLGKPLMVAENFRFFQAERTVRKLLQEGRIGRIGSIVCIDRRDQPSRSQGPWVKSMPDPFLNEIAVHHFDSFRYLFASRPESILARSFNPPGSDYNEGAALEALISLRNGLSIQYSGTLVATKYEYDLWIEGEEGEIRTDRKSVSWRPKGEKSFQKATLVEVPKGDELPYPRAGTVSILNQFRDAVVQNAEPETSGADNIWTLAMVEAARLSQKEGRRARIDEVFTPEMRARAGVDGPNRSGSAGGPKRNESVAVGKPAGGDGHRVLFIGLDSVDAVLVEQWEKEGLLPNIARMRARGTSGRIRTTAEILHVSAWASIFTGVTPDKHGLYHAYVMNPGDQSPTRPKPDRSPFPFFWKLLSDAGKRSVVMDAFMSCPLENFNGSQIVEWGTWSWFSEPAILPAGLKSEMESRFGKYPAPEHSQVATMPDSRWFRDTLIAGVKKKTEVIKWLMQREKWDLLLAVYGETHPAGHYLWHLHDASYPSHPKEVDPALRNALRAVYAAVDHGIGEILKQTDPRTTVFLVSGDGMGPNYSASHVLEQLLKEMRLTVTSGADGQAGLEAKSGFNLNHLLSRLRKMLPQRLRTAVSQRFFSHSLKERLALKWLTAGIVWEKTRAFLISNANEGYVRINLKGREPQGIVEPGAEYAQLIDELAQVAGSLANPATGKRAALAIHKSDEIFRGPCRSQLPDLIINWDPEARVTNELLAGSFGRIRTHEPGYGIVPFYVGNHRPNAFAIVTGPEVPEGERLEDGHILDLAPTILWLLGLEAPEHMDGKVLVQLLGEKQLAVRP